MEQQMKPPSFLYPAIALLAPLHAWALPDTIPVAVKVPPAPKFRIAAYLPEYRVLSLDPAVAANVTDLIFFSIEPTPDGGIDSSRLTPEIEARLMAIKKRYHVRLMVAFGGGDRSSSFPAMATDAGRRALFVENMAQFLTRHGFDGVDFDWEFPNNPAEKDGLTALVVETKRRLKPLGMQVSVATAPGDWFDPKLIAAADQFNVMSYFDESRHVGLAVSQTDVNHLLRNGAKPEQISLGIPFYAKNTITGVDDMSYGELEAKHHIAPKEDTAGDHIFNGIQTVKDKTQYTLDRGLGGVMIFELGQDTGSGALSHAIHRMIDPTPDLLSAEAGGTYLLTADNAVLEGPAAQIETSVGISDIGYWTSMDDRASWRIAVPPAKAGKYRVSLEYACDPLYAGSSFVVTIDGTHSQTFVQTVPGTKSWDDFRTMILPDTATLAAGETKIHMQAKTLPSGDLINLRKIVLTPVAR